MVGRLHKFTTTKNGYRRIELRRSGERRARYVQHLVLEAFAGPCPEGQEARHLNGAPADNRSKNLCWGTDADQALDKIRHGRTGKKLSVDLVRKIRQSPKTGAELARELGVNKSSVNRARIGKVWAHVQGEE